MRIYICIYIQAAYAYVQVYVHVCKYVICYLADGDSKRDGVVEEVEGNGDKQPTTRAQVGAAKEESTRARPKSVDRSQKDAFLVAEVSESEED